MVRQAHLAVEAHHRAQGPCGFGRPQEALLSQNKDDGQHVFHVEKLVLRGFASREERGRGRMRGGAGGSYVASGLVHLAGELQKDATRFLWTKGYYTKKWVIAAGNKPSNALSWLAPGPPHL